MENYYSFLYLLFYFLITSSIKRRKEKKIPEESKTFFITSRIGAAIYELQLAGQMPIILRFCQSND